MYKVRHGTQQRTKSEIVSSLRCLPATILVLHDSLLKHVTDITEVGPPYIDQMNDDVPEVDSECYQALSSPCF